MRRSSPWHVIGVLLVGCAPATTEPSAPSQPVTGNDAPAPASDAASQPAAPPASVAPAAAAPSPRASRPTAPAVLRDKDTACIAKAPAGSFYAQAPKTLVEETPYGLCNYKGKVLLVVNTASFCGATPQLPVLESIFQRYVDRGFVVLGFPSQSFLQEFDNGQDVVTYCNSIKLTFPMFAISDVKGPQINPTFAWLTSQPGLSGDVQWNFEKFLVSRKGALLRRFATLVEPNADEVTSAIEDALAETP